jgi:hypothetical protein
MPSGARGRMGVLCLALAWLGMATAATAASPELRLSLGNTLGANGDPGGSGVSAAGGMMWPVADRFAFGAVLFADDLGTGLATLHDPNTGLGLGTVANAHRWTFGGEWRGEWRLHDSPGARLLWGAGFGYGRQEIDQRGQVRDAVSGAVASTGVTYLLKAAHGHAIGAALAVRHALLHRASDPARSTNWATAALEWRWQGTPKD